MEGEEKVTGKTDIDFKLRIEERPSIELRDWMYNDVLITLWESRPVLVKQQEEGSEDVTAKTVLDEATQLPQLETLNRGVSLQIDLNPN